MSEEKDLEAKYSEEEIDAAREWLGDTYSNICGWYGDDRPNDDTVAWALRIRKAPAELDALKELCRNYLEVLDLFLCSSIHGEEADRRAELLDELKNKLRSAITEG